MAAPPYWKQATRELAARDAVLKRLIARHRGFALMSRGDAFCTLARAIVGQQISVKAAQSIWDRLLAELAAVTPGRIACASAPLLKSCGLSGKKVEYLQDIARRFASGALDAGRWHALDDEALVGELVGIKGVGRWTAEMFLIFYMARPDVLPLDDIGLQRAISLHYNRGRPLSVPGMRRIARPWAPWRSVATWYLWRSLDPMPVEY